MSTKKIGLALGGGGAKGLAHIPIMEVLDELGVRPYRIAGTSIGAVVGALYASGRTASQIREGVRRMVISRGDSFKAALRKKDVLKWFEFLDVEFSGRALFKGDKFIQFLYDSMGVAAFEELQIPLRVVATDFWTSEQVVIESGPLLPAVKASMGLPGVFTPVVLNGRTLIDGGGVNPVPYDLLEDCDLRIAVDVMGVMIGAKKRSIPHLFRAVLGTFDIMQHSIMREKMAHDPAEIYVKPEIAGIELLEFFKADEVYAQAEPAREKLKRELEKRL
ncbi:MAG: patatin-like phospholipase family protein [Lentisphaerae bacterium]|nr:patatin-like phospholipase family protein [Lentisphaerota bacterium]